jgi:drug/metabolite transporter (DMT)-like permease
MGESEIRAGNDDLLQSLDQDFQSLQRHFAAQLAQDIEYLKAEKLRLLEAIETLRQEYDTLEARYRALQSTSETAFSQQQLAQQQVWAKRLAQVLAKNLQADLHHYVINAADSDLPNPAKDWLTSLDETLSHTVQSLQRDLSSYQSAMAQQLTRMQNMERQGEVILENLVKRLSQQLQTQISSGLNNQPLLENREVYLEKARPGSQLAMEPARRLVPPYGGKTVSLPQTTPRSSSSAQHAPSRPEKRIGAVRKGLVLGAIATLLMALQTVLVGAISRGGTVFSLSFSGLDAFNFQNANALLWLRLLVWLPILLIMAPQLHRPVWADLQTWSRKRSLLLSLVTSGSFLFFSQVFLYQAAAQLGPALAGALLFIYPLVAIPLNWLVNGERPSSLRWVVLVAITMGSILLIRPAVLDLGNLTTQTGAAILSAIAFGLYLVTMNLHLHRQCHPISVGVAQFSTMTVISSLILLISPLGFTQDVINPWQFAMGGLGLGVLTSAAYFLNYAGLRLVGGRRAALVAATTPLMTALIAVFGFSNQPTLQTLQWTGVLLVTLGVLTLALDRLYRK